MHMHARRMPVLGLAGAVIAAFAGPAPAHAQDPVEREAPADGQDDHEVEVVVGRASSHFPVPKAKVWVLPATVLDDASVRRILVSDGRLPASLLAERSPIVANDGGAVTVRVEQEELLVYAEGAGGAGWHFLSPDDPDDFVKLLVADDDAVVVRLVDQDGRPVPHRPVRLSYGTHPRQWREHSPVAESVTRDPDGRALMMNLDRLMETMRTSVDGLSFDLTAVSLGLFLEPPHVRLPREASGGEFQMQMPATGSLSIRTGNPELTGTVDVRGHQDDQWITVEDVPLRNGDAELPYVGLGFDLDVELTLTGESGAREASTWGPQSPGEHVVVEFPVEPALTITGRFLDSKGRPITRSRVERATSHSARRPHPLDPPEMLIFGARSHYPDRVEFEPDDEGRFRVVLEDHDLGPGFYAVQIDFADKTAGWAGRESAKPHVVKLGDMQLEKGPVLAAGRVVDVTGNPVPDAHVEAQVFGRSGPQTERWFDVPGTETRSDEDGRFLVMRTYPMEEGRLVASATLHHQDEPFLFQAGQEDCEVVLAAGGGVRVTWRGPESLRSTNVKVELREPSGEVLWGNEPDTDRDQEDTVVTQQWESLAPGTHDVRLFLEPFPEPLITIGGIRVSAGDWTQDPRLREIDLFPLLAEYEVRIVDAQGRPIEAESDSSFEATHLYVLGDRPRKIYSYEDERLLAPARQPFDLVVAALGYQPKFIEDVSGDLVVTLERGVSLTLQLPDWAMASGVHERLGLTYGPDPDPSGTENEPLRDRLMLGVYPVFGDPPRFDAAGRLEVRFPGPGTYGLLWRTEGFPTPTDLEDDSVPTLTVTEEDDGTVRVVEPPRDLLQELSSD